MALDDATLRDAAIHRGLKLVKSRKRKPGVGDYGRFGLTDAKGNALFGVDDNGLTATAQEIADYLRKDEALTWAESAKATPDRADQDTRRPPADADDDAVASAIRPRRRATRRTAEDAPARKPTARAKAEPHPDSRPEPVAKPEPAPPSGRRPPSKAKDRKPVEEVAAAPVPRPELAIRAARAGDAEALVRIMGLIGFGGTDSEMEQSVAAASKRKEPVFVADRGEVLGCVAWHIVPTVQHGAIARITAIVVEEAARREGIGRALFEAVTTEISKRRIDRIEAMSEIEVRNANGFYRALGLEQASYRFVGKT